MSTIREGGAIEEKLPGARRSYSITMPGNMFAQVGNALVENLGFSHEKGLNASRTFAQELYSLSRALDKSRPMNPDRPDYNEALEQSLNLKSDQGRVISAKVLGNLTKIGAPIRGELSEAMEDELRRLGYLSDAPDPRLDEPALTFQTGRDARGPILWEMMYELGQADEVDWHEFWGFRVPITYWVSINRTQVILLHRRKRALSAINDDLTFADREVSALTRRLEHESLVAALRRQVRGELPSYVGNQDPDIWLQERQAEGKHWLSRFFELRWPNVDEREEASTRWKHAVLKKIFGNPQLRYDVVHFACHCEPSDSTAFLSRLDMTVGGEPVSLDVGFIQSDLVLKKKWQWDDPGPLVFLNACGTGERTSPGYEPPGFPEKWINAQGALAVIATLCPVPDYFAHAFAQKFYEILFDPGSPRNCYLGEALLATRRYFMEEYNNPLGLAYVLYSLSDARIETDPGQGTVP